MQQTVNEVILQFESLSDESLVAISEVLATKIAERDAKRKEAARERARAILREAGLTSLDGRQKKSQTPRKLKGKANAA